MLWTADAVEDLKRLALEGKSASHIAAALGVGSRNAVSPTLAGKSVVVTGTVPGYTREEAEQAVLARGGKSPGSVSRSTFALVVGESPGSAKLAKAESLGIPILAGDAFEALLVTGELPGG